MTSKTVKVQADGLVTLVAEAFPAGVASSTAAQSDLATVAIADELLSDLLQKLHMVKPHVLGVSDTRFILWVGTLQEGDFRTGTNRKDARE